MQNKTLSLHHYSLLALHASEWLTEICSILFSEGTPDITRVQKNR